MYVMITEANNNTLHYKVNVYGNLNDKTSQHFSWIDQVTNIQAKT